MNCNSQIENREKCYRIYGKNNEDCLVQELEEKRCLAFRHCPKEAQAYYGTPQDTTNNNNNNSIDDEIENNFNNNNNNNVITKALCASWAEAFCFTKPTIMILNNDDDDRIRDHHLKAQEIVNEDRIVKKGCRSIAMDLARCLRVNK